MTGLAWQLARNGGWPRMVLVVVCTAVAGGLLLVGVTLLDLPEQPREQLSNLAADPGVRGGTAFGAALLTVPVLGALDVGVPSLVGGIAGLGVFWLLRVVLGGVGYDRPDRLDTANPYFSLSENLRVVPTTVGPTWWQVVLVVALVGALGAGAGVLGSRGLTLTPLGVTRRVPVGPPRAWGLLLLVAAVGLGVLSVSVPDLASSLGSTAVGSAAVAFAVLGTAGLAPWAAYVIGRRVQGRASSAVTLLAASRIEAEPGPIGRAAGAAGGIALVSGGCGGLAADLLAKRNADYTYWGPLLLVTLLLVTAVAVTAWTLAVHTVESLLDRRRSTAALAAGGMSLAELERCLRLECGLVAVPLAAAGALVGAVVLGIAAVMAGLTVLGLLLMVTVVALTPALVWLAIVLAVRLIRPWTVRASAAENLRTE